MIREEVVKHIRIKQAQEEKGWIAIMKKCLVGNVNQMGDEDAKTRFSDCSRL